ncbi:unnamed protein product [Lota lota]
MEPRWSGPFVLYNGGLHFIMPFKMPWPLQERILQQNVRRPSIATAQFPPRNPSITQGGRDFSPAPLFSVKRPPSPSPPPSAIVELKVPLFSTERNEVAMVPSEKTHQRLMEEVN